MQLNLNIFKSHHMNGLVKKSLQMIHTFSGFGAE